MVTTFTIFFLDIWKDVKHYCQLYLPDGATEYQNLLFLSNHNFVSIDQHLPIPAPLFPLPASGNHYCNFYLCEIDFFLLHIKFFSLFHLTQCPLDSSMMPQRTGRHSFLWLNSIVYMYCMFFMHSVGDGCLG